MKEALFYTKLKNKEVQCKLCPRECRILLKKRSFCGVRENQDGKLISLVYGKPCSINFDPIEKKPLFHFAPGTSCLSIGTVGCNLNCSFCQNFDISHPKQIFGEEKTPEEIIEIAKEYGVPGIAYTYTEPTVAIEYYLEIMALAKKQGLYNVWVSNGYTNPEPAKQVAKYLDAINVDMKGDLKFYQKLCGIPSEDPVHKALKIYKEAGVWIEITNLIIPGYNDQEEQIEKLVEWIKNNLGIDVPLHFSRFFPNHKLTNVEPTPVETLEASWKIARDSDLRWVYIGNIPNSKESTYCWRCGKVIIKREGFEIGEIKTKCECGTKVPIIKTQ